MERTVCVRELQKGLAGLKRGLRGGAGGCAGSPAWLPRSLSQSRLLLVVRLRASGITCLHFSVSVCKMRMIIIVPIS